MVDIFMALNGFIRISDWEGTGFSGLATDLAAEGNTWASTGLFLFFSPRFPMFSSKKTHVAGGI